MKLEELVESLNLDAVAGAIGAVEEGKTPLRDYDLEDARRMVKAVIEKWLLKDFLAYERAETEQMVVYPIGSMGQIKGIIDVEFWATDTLTILDWKTSKNTLDSEWVRRLQDSWQWRYYALMVGAHKVMYRGIARPKLEKGNWVCETRQIQWDVPESNGDAATLQLEGQLAQRQALVELGLKIWPRSMPGACMAFGQLCPFIDDCRKFTMPLQHVYDKDLSYTSLERFSLCPERHRRMLLEPDRDESEEAAFGKGVHRGLAEVYRQAWELKKGQ